MKVSICMITYNHQDYIEQAINGVLMQKTNFEFELIISNDNSTDNSDLVIKNHLNNHEHKDKVKYINNKENMGMMPNFINTLEKCTGQYIAICEGDDYWTDELKLQKQADFLDQNKDFSICFHKMRVKDKEGIKDDFIIYNNQITSIHDLAKGNYIHTCSVMYRNNLFEKFPEYFYISPVGDYFLHLLNSQYGKIYCFDEKMAVYRIHDTSYWSSKKQQERETIWIDFLKNIKHSFSTEIQLELDKQIELYVNPQLRNNDTEIPKIIMQKKTFFKKLSNSINKRLAKLKRYL